MTKDKTKEFFDEMDKEEEEQRMKNPLNNLYVRVFLTGFLIVLLIAASFMTGAYTSCGSNNASSIKINGFPYIQCVELRNIGYCEYLGKEFIIEDSQSKGNTFINMSNS